jgi:putative SOS response-associated peptidase YedK
MCGRFTLTTDLKEIADRFSAPSPSDELSVLKPRYNIAPPQSVIVVGDDGQRYMKQMKC